MSVNIGTGLPRISHIDHEVYLRHVEYLQEHPTGLLFTYIDQNETMFCIRAIFISKNMSESDTKEVISKIRTVTGYDSIDQIMLSAETFVDALSVIADAVIQNTVTRHLGEWAIMFLMDHARTHSDFFPEHLNYAEVYWEKQVLKCTMYMLDAATTQRTMM